MQLDADYESFKGTPETALLSIHIWCSYIAQRIFKQFTSCQGSVSHWSKFIENWRAGEGKSASSKWRNVVCSQEINSYVVFAACVPWKIMYNVDYWINFLETTAKEKQKKNDRNLQGGWEGIYNHLVVALCLSL